MPNSAATALVAILPVSLSVHCLPNQVYATPFDATFKIPALVPVLLLEEKSPSAVGFLFTATVPFVLGCPAGALTAMSTLESPGASFIISYNFIVLLLLRLVLDFFVVLSL